MRKVALVALALSPLAAFGCTALLGDFEVSATANNAAEAGDDGTSGGDGPSDGPMDGGDPDAFDAQSLAFTTCGINESSIRTIEELVPDSGQPAYTGQLEIFRINQSTVRVVAQKNQMNDGATVYSFDPKNGSGPLTPTIVDLQTAGRYLDARRLPNQGIIALMFLERLASAMAHVKVFELPDTNLSGQLAVNLSTDFADPTAGGGGGGGGLSGTLGAYPTNNEYFWAIGGSPSGANSYDLIVGHRVGASVPTPVVVHTTTDDRLVRLRAMARSQQTQYIFNDEGPEAQTDPGASYFAVPQDTTTTVPAKTLRPIGGTKPFVLIGASGISTGDGLRLAAAEVDFTSANFGSVRAGLVSQADLTAGFDGTKVPLAFPITSFADVPSEGEARFFGADMLWLGTPPDPLKGQGLNFIWYDTDRRVMRIKQTGMQRMLQTHQAIEKTAVWLESQTAVNADADVVFVEKVVGGKFLLQYGRLSCIR
jgi:hypothetical protein